MQTCSSGPLPYTADPGSSQIPQHADQTSCNSPELRKENASHCSLLHHPPPHPPNPRLPPNQPHPPSPPQAHPKPPTPRLRPLTAPAAPRGPPAAPAWLARSVTRWLSRIPRLPFKKKDCWDTKNNLPILGFLWTWWDLPVWGPPGHACFCPFEEMPSRKQIWGWKMVLGCLGAMFFSDDKSATIQKPAGSQVPRPICQP